MTVDWIKPIYNRTYADVLTAEDNPDMESPIGCYNSVDLNRVENNTKYVWEDMFERGIIREQPSLSFKLNWVEDEIVTGDNMNRIISNVMVLQSLSNPLVMDDFLQIYSATQMTYSLANAIEKNLLIMKNQPVPDPNKFLLTVENGIIREYGASKAEIAENEVVTIEGIPYGDDAEYMIFTHWSGDTNDLQYVEDPNAQVTTFIGQYHDVTLTANFEVHFRRRLTINSGYISESGEIVEEGPSTALFDPGANILIIANVAPMGKRFYEWIGTQAAIDNLIGGPQPSSSWLAMPDCDVVLTAKYINAGEHYVNIINGTGSGWYDYNEIVNISPNVPSHYTFSHWSGDTQWLDSSTSMSFKMPDVNVQLTANFEYVYSYNTVTVVNGTIDGQTRITNARQGSTHTLVADPAPSGYGHVGWTVEGYGRASMNSFTVGDGNATVIARYAPLRRITVENVNNRGGSTTYTVPQGRSISVSTSSSAGGNYYFSRWVENGATYSDDEDISITAGSKDRTITAVYVYREPVDPDPPSPPSPPKPVYTVTVYNRDDAGQTETWNVTEGRKWEAWTAEDTGDTLLVGWYEGGNRVGSTSHYDFYVYEDTYLEVDYRYKETYYLSVRNGSGSGYYKEREVVQISADPGSTYYRFDGWSLVSGSLRSMGSGSTTTVTMGRSNATVAPTYSHYYDLTVITFDGTWSTIVEEGAGVNISAGTPPNYYEWDRWIQNSGNGRFANYLNSNTVYYMGTSDAVIEATHKGIPWYTLTVINGHGSGEYIRGSSPTISMYPAPEGHQFLQWEVLLGGEDDVVHPRAETSYIRNMQYDITVRAIYYIPNPEVKYVLTVENKNGEVFQSEHAVGEQVQIYADYPDEGWIFYKWTGDAQFLMNKYNPETIVNMPPKNITVKAEYRREGFITMYHLILEAGECLITNESGNSYWNFEGEFVENSIVHIRAINIPTGFRFAGWKGSEESMSTVADLMGEETTVHIQDFDVTLSRNIIEMDKYILTITGTTPDDPVSGTYYAGAPVQLYFSLTDTNEVRYIFERWSGDVGDIDGWEGNVFDIMIPGTQDAPQIIAMPAKDIKLTPIYTSEYRLFVENGSIDNEDVYFAEGTQVKIIAENVNTQAVFVCWEGDIEYIDNIYTTIPTITMPAHSITLKAKFTTNTTVNSVGYTEEALNDSETYPISKITMISGVITNGTIITDNEGHIFMVTNFDEENVAIQKLTKVLKGGNVYE